MDRLEYRDPVVETVARPGGAPAPPRRRDPWFDNAKMGLVTLVVLGHSWTLLPVFAVDPGSATAHTVDKGLYYFLYLWHIPAFVLVTGYLSRSFTWSRTRLWSLVRTVAVPYVIFEGLLVAYRHYVGGVEFQNIWTNPHWPMWYLSALFFWRLATPVFLRVPAKVVVAVAISLLAGLYATDTFDNARILGLLPFYVLGLKMHEGHWALLRTRRARWYGAATMLTLFVAAFFADQWGSTEWLYYRSRYDVLDPDDLRAITIRMVLLIVGVIGAFAFLTLVPRVRGWFSTMGAATLVVYLYHGFFVLSAEFAGFKPWAADHWPVSLVLVSALAPLLAMLLAWSPVSARLNWLVDPLGTLPRRRTGSGRWFP